MEDLMKAAGTVLLFACMIFLAPIFGVLVGAFSGWVVSILAPVWVPTGLKAIGLHVEANQLVEVGAALGFAGGFFRSHLKSNKE